MYVDLGVQDSELFVFGVERYFLDQLTVPSALMLVIILCAAPALHQFCCLLSWLLLSRLGPGADV